MHFQAQAFGKKLKENPDFSDPKKINGSALGNLGQLSQGLGKKFLKELPDDSVYEARDKLKDVDFKPSERKELYKKMEKQMGVCIL